MLARLADRPTVVAVDDLLDDEHRMALLDLMDRALAGESVPGIDPSGIERDVTGAAFEFDPTAHPSTIRWVERLRDVLRLGPAVAGSLRFRRYGPGNRHPMHTDHYVIDGWPLVVTALFCLGHQGSGGETTFPYARVAPIAVPAVSGRLVAWTNVLPDGTPDPLALHEGALVRSGVKSTVTWFVYADPASCPFVQEQ